MRRVLATLLVLVLAGGARSELQVVATSSGGGALLREIGAERVALIVLAPPDRDLHTLQLRPSMMRALRRADLVFALGADLELGWLPVALQQAANPRVLPGRPGYFEAAAQVQLLGANRAIDRALGDVHPLGNPHVNMDPVRWLVVARALSLRLGELDPEGQAAYQKRLEHFAGLVEARLPRWRAQLAGAAGAVLYHEDATYLLARFGVPLLGVLEPVPGVPPSGSHIRGLLTTLKGGRGVIIHAPYQAAQAPGSLARSLGWPVFQLSLDPPLEADGVGYLRHMDRWVEALAAAVP